MRFDDGSPASVARVVHGFYLFPLLLGLILAIFGSVIGILDTRGTGRIRIVMALFALVGASLFLVGRWMRSTLPTRNPRAWCMHAVLGPVFLAAYASIVLIGLWASYSDHSLLRQIEGLMWVIPQLYLILLPGVRLQRLWMSQEMRMHFSAGG
jgi:hypothetical protein